MGQFNAIRKWKIDKVYLFFFLFSRSKRELLRALTQYPVSLRFAKGPQIDWIRRLKFLNTTFQSIQTCNLYLELQWLNQFQKLTSNKGLKP